MAFITGFVIGAVVVWQWPAIKPYAVKAKDWIVGLFNRS